MMLIQSPRGIALVGPGYCADVPIGTVYAYQRAGVPGPHAVSASDHDLIRAHARANPPSVADVDALAEAMAGPVARYLAPRLSVLPDSDLERIRDAAVEALELSKGHVRGTVIHLQRGTTPPPPA